MFDIPGATMPITYPARVVLNNHTISIFTGTEYETVYKYKKFTILTIYWINNYFLNSFGWSLNGWKSFIKIFFISIRSNLYKIYKLSRYYFNIYN